MHYSTNLSKQNSQEAGNKEKDSESSYGVPNKSELKKVDDKILKKYGLNGHSLKGGGQGKSNDATTGASKRNVYKDKNGNLYQWDGRGEPEPTGHNLGVKK